MTDQELDALMKRVLIDSMKLDLEADGAGQTASFTPSLQHRRQMKAMLKDPLGWSRKKARPVWKMIAQKAAVVLLVISVGFGAIMAASPTARATFVRWITEWYETHIVYRYFGDQIAGGMPKYEISVLPEGYSESQREEQPNSIFAIYQNEANENPIFLRYIYMQQGSAIDFDIENSESIPIMIQGWEGILYTSENAEYSTITWIDPVNNIQFVVDVPLGQTDILEIAESVVPEKP